MENREPSKVIVAYLKERIAEGRIYHPTKIIAAGTGLSRKVVGTRMFSMMSTDWHGLLISKWSDKTWRASIEVKHGRRGIRETV
jgi:hypothetical protein